MQTQFDIFISYSDKDRELTRKIYETLKAEGFSCWVAFNDIPHGEIWSKAITQGIKNSKTFLLILTPNSNASDQVLREIEYADKQKKKLYCYKTEILTVSDTIDYFISSIQQFEAYQIAFEIGIKRITLEFRQYLSIEKPYIQVITNRYEAKKYFDEGKIAYDDKKYEKAYIPLLQAANLGLADAQYYVGRMYNYGQYVNKDIDLATQWYLKAAEQGLADAQFDLGWNYYYEASDRKQDFSLAMHWYQKASEQGRGLATFMIGNIYYYGYGLKQDYTLAMQWYLKAAEQGSSDALYAIGRRYHHGEGVKQNYILAMQWYLKLIEFERGTYLTNFAQCSIGEFYFQGLGVNQDKQIAKEWFLKSAKNGNNIAKGWLKNKYGMDRLPFN